MDVHRSGPVPSLVITNRFNIPMPWAGAARTELQEQMGAQICAGQTELESGCGQGQGCNEGGGSKNAAQGTNLQIHNPTVKDNLKRPREAPTRVGCRRMRETENGTPDDDDETHEIVKRGATTMDCKRRCENSGIS